MFNWSLPCSHWIFQWHIHIQPTHLDTKLQSKQCSKMSCHIEWQCDECFMLIFQLLHFHLWCDFVTIHISVFIYWHISGWVENCSVQAVSSVTHFLKEKKNNTKCDIFVSSFVFHVHFELLQLSMRYTVSSSSLTHAQFLFSVISISVFMQ